MTGMQCAPYVRVKCSQSNGGGEEGGKVQRKVER